MKLHEAQVVSDKMFYHTTEMKLHENKYHKTFRLQAKYFDSKEPEFTHSSKHTKLLQMILLTKILTKSQSGYSNLWVIFTCLDLLRSQKSYCNQLV